MLYYIYNISQRCTEWHVPRSRQLCEITGYIYSRCNETQLNVMVCDDHHHNRCSSLSMSSSSFRIIIQNRNGPHKLPEGPIKL